VILVFSAPCQAWWEAGHQVIAVLAYEQLSRDQQEQLQRILDSHPRINQDFRTPPKATTPLEIEHWRIGRAGYWPDVARSQPEFHRSTWHYQLGATLVVGQPKVPQSPGAAPVTADLTSQDLHIAQALAVCERTFRDSSSSADRAIALCWLAHLVGDAHQPCHAGSFYEARVFPEGDRGANLIPTRQRKNLHALWDSLLGDGYDGADIRRRCQAIRQDTALWESAARAAADNRGLNPQLWLAESVEYGRSHVYSPEILNAVSAVERGLTAKLEPIDLSDEYLEEAGAVARRRAAYAAHRLARLLQRYLK